jgi:hypothetical protein
MSVWARLKSIAGGDRVDTDVAQGTTIVVPDNTNLVYITGSASVTVATLKGNASTANRLVTFVQKGTGTTTFENDDTPAANQMDLGGSNRALGQHDVLCLLLKPDGTWLRAFGPIDN